MTPWDGAVVGILEKGKALEIPEGQTQFSVE